MNLLILHSRWHLVIWKGKNRWQKKTGIRKFHSLFGGAFVVLQSFHKEKTGAVSSITSFLDQFINYPTRLKFFNSERKGQRKRKPQWATISKNNNSKRSNKNHEWWFCGKRHINFSSFFFFLILLSSKKKRVLDDDHFFSFGSVTSSLGCSNDILYLRKSQSL